MNELYHYGVLGMKWGVRRYQPYGKGGYNPKNKGSVSDTYVKVTKPSIKRGKDKEDVSLAQEFTKDTKDIFDNVNKIRKRNESIHNIKKATQMSDEELRDVVNRLRLEKEYNELTIKKGENKADNILDTVGDVLSIGVSLAAILAAVYNLTNGGNK